MNPRIVELTAQGWQHPEMMYAVEWAQNGEEEELDERPWCQVCGHALLVRGLNESTGKREWSMESHDPRCLIPYEGYRVLKDAHWYERRWDWNVEFSGGCLLVASSEEDWSSGHPPSICHRPRGHDNGVHEPQEGGNPMTTHTYHPDTHEFGLADGCPRCEEHAEYPFEGLDNRNLAILIARIFTNKPSRSFNEGRAVTELRMTMLKAERMMELGWKK